MKIPVSRPDPNLFASRVCAVVKKIPNGKVMTYGEVARAAGSPGAARAVGNILKQNFDPTIPCHRVIRSDGSLGEYNRGAKKKRALLIEEGAISDRGRSKGLRSPRIRRCR